jgi:glycolate oxidase
VTVPLDTAPVPASLTPGTPSASHGSVVPEILAPLLEALSSWSTDPADLERGRTDRSGWFGEGTPLLWVRATSAADVSVTLAFATTHGIPVVTRGSGTGLAGGASAGGGCIVLDLSGLNAPPLIDAANRTATVQPGVITADLDAAAAAVGLRYAPDPASYAISSIGGNIATNAGGLRGAKYGVTRDAVLELTVVLADGSVLRTGRQTLKGVTGYDLTSLFVGSEGTLGVVVEATLRLQPIPPRTVTIAAFFATIGDAAAASSALAVAPVQPSILEIVDGPTLAAIDAAQGTEFRERGGAFLLAQTDGFGAAEEAAVVAEVLGRTATLVEFTEDDAQAQVLLATRRLALPSLERIGRVLIEDIAVPRSRLAEAVLGIEEISARTGVRIFTLGHAGDGNLHPIIVVARPESGEDAEIGDDAWAAAGEIFALALRLGGTLTAEHGVGVLKQRWVREEVGEVGYRLHSGVKELLDPAGILNPGKAF